MIGAHLMARSPCRQALLVLAVLATGDWHSAGAAEFQCRNGDALRRVELTGPDATEGAACEVRYWRDAKAPDTGRSLWRANQDTDFCTTKARELIARLEAGGWTCDASQQAALATPAPAAGADPLESSRPPAAAPAAQALRPGPTQAAPSSTPGPAAALPAEPPSPAVAPIAPPTPPAQQPSPAVAHTEPAAPPAESPAPVVARAEPSPPPAAATAPVVTRAGPSPSTEESPAPVVTRVAPSAPDEPAAPPPANAKAALLDQIVEQTLRSVQELYGGQFEAERAAFGDLDGDELEDAVVLITYQAARDDYVQYLVAYLFNGETFQSVATRNVGGRFLDAARADLRGIAEGQILVELEALGEGASCCSRRRTAFALENGQLVEVGDPGAASLESPSQAEQPSPG